MTVVRAPGVTPQLLVHADDPSQPASSTPFLPIDTTGDGQADALVADTDLDGRADALVLDTSGDGVPDTAIPCVLVDTDGDGRGDILLVDTTDNGHADTIIRIFSARTHSSAFPPAAATAVTSAATLRTDPTASAAAACTGMGAQTQAGAMAPPPQRGGMCRGASAAMLSELGEEDVFSILDPSAAPAGAAAGGVSVAACPGNPMAYPQHMVAPGGVDPCTMSIPSAELDFARAASRPKSKADGSLQKQGWTPEEDATIVRMVQLTGQKWSFIACALPGRTDDAVRNRYLRLQKKKSTAKNVTSADLIDCQATKKGDMWTAEEDAKIMEGVSVHGYKWQQIASVLPGRSANAVRNRFLRCSPDHAGEGGRLANTAGGVRAAPYAAGGMPYAVAGMGDLAGVPTMSGIPMPQSMPPGHSVPMPADELMVPVSSGQGVNFFWDASALYGEALGAIHDDLFTGSTNNNGLPPS